MPYHLNVIVKVFWYSCPTEVIKKNTFPVICIFVNTGVLVIENAMSLFRTQPLARRNYWAELAEIWHGILLGDSTLDSRGVFGYSTWGPRKGVPLRVPG